MTIQLTAKSAHKLVLLLAKHYNKNLEISQTASQIDIEKLESGNSEPGVASKFWYVLYPAGYIEKYKTEGWNILRKDDPEKYAEELNSLKDRELNLSCTYDVISTILKVWQGRYFRNMYSPKNKDVFVRIAEYLEIEVDGLIKEILDTSQLNVNQEAIFYNTKWYGHYRTKHPLTDKICIAICVVKINKNGRVVIKNAEENDNYYEFYNYQGSIEMTDENQLIFKLKYDGNSNTESSFILFSLPKPGRKTRLHKTIHGIYLQSVPSGFSARAGTMVFNLVEDDVKWEDMRPRMVDITDEKSDGIPRIPFRSSYPNFHDKIKRLLFDRKHNFISTTKTNLSDKSEFQRKLSKLDLKYSTRIRPIYDIYFSCPIGAYKNNETGFNNMKKEVQELIEKIKSSINFIDYNEDAEIIIRTPFDKDKLPSFDTEVNFINPKVKSREIANSKLFVMYHPDTSVISSCLVEASWAIQAGVCCLFIVDKEDGLPRYLQSETFPRQYPIFICEGGVWKPSRAMNNALGLNITFTID